MLLANRRKGDLKNVSLKNTLCGRCKQMVNCRTCNSQLCVRPKLDVVDPAMCVILDHFEGQLSPQCSSCFNKELQEIIKRGS